MNVAYEETQWFWRNPIFAIIILIVIAAAAVGPILSGRLWPDAIPILIAAIIGLGNMRTRLEQDGIQVRILFLLRRRIPWDDIAQAESVTYRPLRQFGGWGVRFARNGTAFTVSGNQAVKITRASGRELYIGSQHPARLLAAIQYGRNVWQPS